MPSVGIGLPFLLRRCGFFMFFALSLSSLTYFWKCQNELKLLNYFLYTIHTFWQPSSRQVEEASKQFWSLLMGFFRWKIHWPIAEDRFHPWMGDQLKFFGRFHRLCVMNENGATIFWVKSNVIPGGFMFLDILVQYLFGNNLGLVSKYIFIYLLHCCNNII